MTEKTNKNSENKDSEKTDEQILEELSEAVDESVKEKVQEVGKDNLKDSQEASCSHDPDTLEALARERADFLNYKNRANKEIEKARGLGKADATRAFLQVMDEIDRAKKAGDVENDSPFGKVSQKLEDAFRNLGLVKFAEKGEIFDPTIHEALMNREANENDSIENGETKIDEVVEAGYKIGNDVFRTAKVTTVSK